MTSKWTHLPMVECPHCNKEYQQDDYYNMEPGDSMYCHHCDEEIFITEMDTVIEIKVSTDRPAT